MGFSGFDPRAVALLSALPTYDDEQYAAVRDLLTKGLREPGFALIEAVAAATDKRLVTNRRTSVSPLHRDLRFAPAGAPKYKDHLLMCAWQGADKKTAPSLWLRIESNSMGFASGVALDGPRRAQWQAAIGGDVGALLAQELAIFAEQCDPGRMDLAGQRLAKPPKPWPADHPRADLLRMTGFQLRFPKPLPTLIDSPELVGWCVEAWQSLLPVHEWLVAQFGDTTDV